MYSTLVPLCTVKEMLYSRARANTCSKLEATCEYYHINGIALTFEEVENWATGTVKFVLQWAT